MYWGGICFLTWRLGASSLVHEAGVSAFLYGGWEHLLTCMRAYSLACEYLLSSCLGYLLYYTEEASAILHGSGGIYSFAWGHLLSCMGLGASTLLHGASAILHGTVATTWNDVAIYNAVFARN